MSLSQFKVPLCNICLASTVAASWSLTQELTGLNPFTVLTNIFATEFAEFRENI